jgi:bifunctional DNA-binding transcriptional regulator/antitoxin component of YhaV-PrlF toxin-antitoxin module
MKRIIVKVDRRDISFRVTIPRKVIQYKKWNDVEYMLLEESGDDRIVLRRFLDGEELDTDSQRPIPGFD